MSHLWSVGESNSVPAECRGLDFILVTNPLTHLSRVTIRLLDKVANKNPPLLQLLLQMDMAANHTSPVLRERGRPGPPGYRPLPFRPWQCHRCFGGVRISKGPNRGHHDWHLPVSSIPTTEATVGIDCNANRSTHAD